MFERLRKLIVAPERKASHAARLIAFKSGGRSHWAPRDYAGLAHGAGKVREPLTAPSRRRSSLTS